MTCVALMALGTGAEAQPRSKINCEKHGPQRRLRGLFTERAYLDGSLGPASAKEGAGKC